MPSIAAEVTKTARNVDTVVVDYATGYIRHLENNIGPQHDLTAEASFIASLLVGAGVEKPAAQQLYDHMLKEFTVLQKEAINEAGASAQSQIIDQQALMSAVNHASNRQASVLNNNIFGVADLDHVGGRKVESRVDKKKLEKAEKKIAAKMAARAAKDAAQVQYEASKLVTETQDSKDYDEFFLTVNPLDLGMAGAGKTKDIKIDNFDLHVGMGQRILSDTSLTLSYGRRYGLVGQNGIGKSTLLRALSRRELPVPKHITILHVEQEITGDETSAIQSVLDADVWRKHLLKEQHTAVTRIAEIEAQRKTLTEQGLDDNSAEIRELDDEQVDLETNLEEVETKLVDIESDKAESRAAAILSGLGFSQATQGNPTNSFSGGWRMRLALARALFCKPDLLLLDEPSNMLDVPSITYLANYLQTYPYTVLVVSHDRAFLNEVATDIIYQHSERLDYYRNANFDAFYATKEERYKNAIREYENQMAYRQHLQAFIDKFRYNAAKSSEAQSRIKKLEKLPILELPEEDKAVEFRFSEPEKISPPILQMQGVTFGYNPERLLLKDVDLDIQMDSRIALVGANGCGKTTLLKLLTDQLSPVDGSISKHPRLRVGYFAQHHVDGMDLNLTPTAWLAKINPGKSEEEYRRHLGSFGITGSIGLQKLALLSGGQKSRVAFASLCVSYPHILILDEPSNHLDTAGLDALADGLKNFKGGILMVSHDVDMINRVCNQIWVSEKGTVSKFDGTIKDYKKYILSHASESGVVQQH